MYKERVTEIRGGGPRKHKEHSGIRKMPLRSVHKTEIRSVEKRKRHARRSVKER